MRCPKCGYVSFDYLARCKKCNVDLTEARQALNLPDFKPEAPFLLGIVVGETTEAGGRAGEEISLIHEAELGLAGLEPSESSSLEETVDIEGEIGSRGDESPVSTSVSDGVKPAASPEEAEISEIVLEDLEAHQAAAGGEAEVEELSLEDLSMEDDQGETMGVKEDEEIMGLEIEAEEEPPLGLKDLEKTGKEPRTSDLASAVEGAAVSGRAEPQAEGGAASEDSALELDLSEADLSSLAKELEEQLESEAGENEKPRAADSAEELEEVILELEKEDES